MRALFIVVITLGLHACGIGSGTEDGSTSISAEADSAEQPNNAPSANAGDDQTVDVGDVVTVSASGTTDADGDELAYAWSIESRPVGSEASLADAAAEATTFTADMVGEYVVQLQVSDATESGEPDSVMITAEASNVAPVANAGQDQNVFTGEVVTLDGSVSNDADDDLITYSWTLTSIPQDSSATLSDSEVVSPTFIADIEGQYSADLIVADAEKQSPPDTVVIMAATANSAPMANAGSDQNVAINSLVVLDGTASSDADDDGLIYKWNINDLPENSEAQLDDGTAASPSFTADVAGSYSINLVVNDGIVDSAPDAVLVVAATSNSAPIANAGEDLDVFVGGKVTLDGSASTDADADPLTYGWIFSSIPDGSESELLTANEQIATFTADSGGVYVVKLTVNDGELSSEPDTVSVVALESDPALSLFETDATLGSQILAWPYSSTRSFTIIADQFECTLASFGLKAVGQDFTVVNVNAASFSTATVSFAGLTESQVISGGDGVSFSLISSPTPGTVSMDYSFEVLETGDTFAISGYVNCATP